MTKTYSMTGYARADGEVRTTGFTIEAKSINHRYLDLKIHLPRQVQTFEHKVAEIVKSCVNRGRVELWVHCEPAETPVKVDWNRPLANGLLSALAEMKEALHLSGDVDLTLLASQKDIILINESETFGDEAWPALADLVKKCLDALIRMRAREGEVLAKDIAKRLADMESVLARISEQAGTAVSSYRDKLEKRINELVSERAGVDQERLAQEVAIFADRSDITEELVRARSHLEQFHSTLEGKGPKGRKLEFLIQEIFREVTTASNKASDAKVAGWVVEIKTELEKIREQVQNLE